MSDHRVLDLGRLELRLPFENLSLHLTGEAKLVVAESVHDDDESASKSFRDALNYNGPFRPWIRKAHNYQVVVDLELEPGLELEDQSITQIAAMRLKDSKIWSGLELTVTSVEVCQKERRVSSWILCLDYNGHNVAQTQQKLHKLAADVPFYDIFPSTGVPSCKLAMVHVKMLVKHNSDCMVPAEQSSTEAGVELIDEHEAVDADMLFAETEDVGDGNDCQVGKAYVSHAVEAINRPAYAAHCGERSKGDTRTAFDRDLDTRKSMDCNTYLTPPSSQEATQRIPERQAMSAELKHSKAITDDSLVKLLEVGLRHAVEKPTQTSKKVTIVSNEDFSSLADIAPTLWVPGYHRWIADRGVFLPTISRAIAKVAAHGPPESRLGSKCKELARRHHHYRQTKGSHSKNGSTKFEELSNVLESALWQLLTSSEPSSAGLRRPKSLSKIIATEWDDSSCQTMGNMLDDNESDLENDSLGEDSDIEDLLDIVSDSDKDSVQSLDEVDQLDADVLLDSESISWVADDEHGTVPKNGDLEPLPGCDHESNWLVDELLESQDASE